MIGLVMLLNNKGDMIEADLRRYYGTDLRDLYRRDENGFPLLTLRQVWVMVRHLPRDSSLAIDDNGGTVPWSMNEHLLADVWLVIAAANSKKGRAPKDHPGRLKQAQLALRKRTKAKAHLFAKAKAREARRRANAAQGGSLAE